MSGGIVWSLLDPGVVLTFGITMVVATYLMKGRGKSYNKPPFPFTRFPIVGNMIRECNYDAHINTCTCWCNFVCQTTSL